MNKQQNFFSIGGRIYDRSTAEELNALARQAVCEPSQIVAGIEAIGAPHKILARDLGISEDRAESIISAIRSHDAKKAPKPTKAPSQARQQAETSRQAREIMARRTAERAAAASPAPRSIARHASQPTAASKSAMVKAIVAKQASYRRK